MNSDALFGLLENHTMFADAKPKKPFELAAQWFDFTGATGSIAMDSRQNVQRGALLDGTNLFRNVRIKSDFLH